MANYDSLKAAIAAVIKENGNNEITGNILQSVLVGMVSSLGTGAQFMGIANPTTQPVTPDFDVAYIATAAGTYFDGTVVKEGQIALFVYNSASGTWSVTVAGMQYTRDGSIIQLQDAQGNNLFPKTLGEAVNLTSGTNLETILKALDLRAGSSVVKGFLFRGIATPSTDPGTPDQNVFYLASTAGTYANFGGLVLVDGEVAILKYNGAWYKDSTGAASLEMVNQLVSYRFFVKNIDESAPENPSFNDKWYNTIDNKVYTYANSWGAGIAAKAGDTVVNIVDNNIYMFDGTGLMPIDYPTPIRPARTGPHIIDYTEDVQELYLLKQYFPSRAGIMLKSYNGTVYLRYVSGSTSRATLVPSANNKIYELKVTQSTDQGVPLGTVVGYIIFRDYAAFLANSTDGEPATVVYEVATDPSHSPIISASLQEGLVKTSMLQDGTVTSGKIANGAVTKVKLAQDIQDNLDAVGGTDTPGVTETLPPRNPYSLLASDYFRGYMLDLTGAYDKGYRAIVFRGATWNGTQPDGIISGTLRAGIIYDDDHNVLEQANGTTSKSNQWFILPIAQNAKTFIGNKCVDAMGGEVFDVTSVHLIDIKVYEAIINAANVPAMQADIEALKVATSAFPGTFLPKKIYGVVGDTLQLFVRGIVRSNAPYRFYNKFTCGQGKVYDRYLEVTPALVNGAVPTSLTIKHKFIGDSYNASAEKTAQFKISARPTASPASNINVLCIGASTTQNGEWVAELKRRLTGTRDTGTPQADGLTNINFVGRKEALGVHLEATGGWSWRTFYTPQDAIRFQVTGITSVNIGDIYTFTDASSNVVKVQVAEVNVTGDTGNIRFLYTDDSGSHGVPASASGSISRVSGTGDATITYTAFSPETYCPFAGDNPGECSFTDYANTYCDGHIDVAIFLVGTLNSGVIGDASLDGVIANMKVMLDALHTDFPNCKVILGTPIGVSQQHGAEYNYGAISDYTQWSIQYVDFRYAEALQDFIADDNYKDWCFLANPLGEVDSEYVFPTTSKPVNVRMSTPTEDVGTNGAHPTNAGYMMTADSFYRCFVNEML